MRSPDLHANACIYPHTKSKDESANPATSNKIKFIKVTTENNGTNQLHNLLGMKHYVFSTASVVCLPALKPCLMEIKETEDFMALS